MNPLRRVIFRVGCRIYPEMKRHSHNFTNFDVDDKKDGDDDVNNSRSPEHYKESLQLVESDLSTLYLKPTQAKPTQPRI